MMNNQNQRRFFHIVAPYFAILQSRSSIQCSHGTCVALNAIFPRIRIPGGISMDLWIEDMGIPGSSNGATFVPYLWDIGAISPLKLSPKKWSINGPYIYIYMVGIAPFQDHGIPIDLIQKLYAPEQETKMEHLPIGMFKDFRPFGKTPRGFPRVLSDLTLGFLM